MKDARYYLIVEEAKKIEELKEEKRKKEKRKRVLEEAKRRAWQLEQANKALLENKIN